MDNVVKEADECTCGRYHSASEWTCYRCGKLVTVKKPEVVSVGISQYCPRCECEPCQCKCDCDIGMCTHRANCRNNSLKAPQNEMNEAKAYVISDSQEMLTFYKQTWNAAIEAVLKIGFDGREEMLIRELKK